MWKENNVIIWKEENKLNKETKEFNGNTKLYGMKGNGNEREQGKYKERGEVV